MFSLKKKKNTRIAIFPIGHESERVADLIPWLLDRVGIPDNITLDVIPFDEAAPEQAGKYDRRLLVGTALVDPRHVADFERALANLGANAIIVNADDVMQKRLLGVFPGVDALRYSLLTPCDFKCGLDLSPNAEHWALTVPGNPTAWRLDLPLGHAGGAFLLAAVLCVFHHLDIPMQAIKAFSEDILFSEVAAYDFPRGSRLLHCSEPQNIYATLAAAQALAGLSGEQRRKTLVVTGHPDCGATGKHVFRYFCEQLARMDGLDAVYLSATYRVNGTPQGARTLAWIRDGDDLSALLKDLAGHPRLIMYFGSEEGGWIRELMLASAENRTGISVPPPKPEPSFSAHAFSHKGNVRTINEDSYFQDAETGLFLLADGMGGHHGGDIASSMAADSAREFAGRWKNGMLGVPARTQPQPLFALLEEIVATSNANIRQLNANRIGRNAMGTTVVIGILHQGVLYFSHVGDSRLYVLRGGLLKQLTSDHSVFWELYVRSGQMKPDDMKKATDPRMFALTRAVGTDYDVEPEFGHLAVQKGDRFLMCSDGLTDEMPESTIQGILESAENPAESLVLETLNTRAKDNITTIVITIHE